MVAWRLWLQGRKAFTLDTVEEAQDAVWQMLSRPKFCRSGTGRLWRRSKGVSWTLTKVSITELALAA